jgi:hypothetical protein
MHDQRYNRTVRYDWLGQYLFEVLPRYSYGDTMALDV